jgi:hypothetical protein
MTNSVLTTESGLSIFNEKKIVDIGYWLSGYRGQIPEAINRRAGRLGGREALSLCPLAFNPSAFIFRPLPYSITCNLEP